MAIFLTGSTGYIGAHVAANLLQDHSASLNLLVRARDPHEAELRLWQALQLHLAFPQFYEHLQARVRIFCGDITQPRFGLADDDYDRLIHTTDSVLHCAASLNRKSEKSCLNVNLRGTLEVVQLAMRSNHYHGLRRFSQVSTVAVAGKRRDEIVREDEAIDWDRSDYDPYARTKKFCEHMIRQLLPEVPITIFRPSIVLGDSRYAETTQFEMVKAFVFLAGLPVLPFRASDKIDIVNVDFVADAIAQGQVQSSGNLLNPEDRSKSVGRVFTVIDLADDLSAYRLPAGAAAQVAVYTEHWQWLAVIRRIILRMQALRGKANRAHFSAGDTRLLPAYDFSFRRMITAR